MASDRVMMLINRISGTVATSSRMVSVCMASSFAVLAVLISREGAKCDLFCNWLDLFGVVSFVVQIVVGGCCGVCALNVVVLCNLCTRFKATISSRGAAELAEKCNQS